MRENSLFRALKHRNYRLFFGGQTISLIGTILILLALVSLMAAPYMVFLPIIASRQLHGNAMTLGYLTASAGIGALADVYFLARRTTVLGLGRVIPTSAITFGLGLMAFA